MDTEDICLSVNMSESRSFAWIGWFYVMGDIEVNKHINQYSRVTCPGDVKAGEVLLFTSQKLFMSYSLSNCAGLPMYPETLRCFEAGLDRADIRW